MKRSISSVMPTMSTCCRRPPSYVGRRYAGIRATVADRARQPVSLMTGVTVRPGQHVEIPRAFNTRRGIANRSVGEQRAIEERKRLTGSRTRHQRHVRTFPKRSEHFGRK